MPGPHTVILLAGPSGSGKSRLSKVTGVPQLRLDDFYFDADHPGLPLTRLTAEVVDWDDPASWDAAAAVQAIRELVQHGRTETPVYDIALSRATGRRELDLGGSCCCLIAEGIFATELIEPCASAGIEVTPVWLDRSRTANAVRRLVRDLRGHRKPPRVLLARGLALWRLEPADRANALARGFRPVSMSEAIQLVRAARQPAAMP